MDAHEQLYAVAEKYWDSVLAASPMLATVLGDRRFDDLIEDLSVEAEQQHVNELRDLLREVDGLEATRLTGEDRITHSLLRTELDSGINHLSWRPVELAYDQMAGVHAQLLTAAPQITAPTPEAAHALVARYRRFGTLLDQAVGRFRAGLAAGRTPARITIERAVDQLDKYLASDPAADPFVTFAGPPGWDGETGWRATLSEISREVIRPAFAMYRAMLAEELAPVARPDDTAGLCWLGEEGERIYAHLLRHHTTVADLTADDIHQLGQHEIDRLAGEYADIGGWLYGTSEVGDIVSGLRDDRALRYDNGEEFMADVQKYLAAANTAMPDWFTRLPKQSCTPVPVPDFLAATVPAAFYYPPAADGSRPGIYFVNQHQPETRSRYGTAAVTFHEAIPGHHLQLTIASELDHLPRFQRQSFSNTAFVEGWGLYAERLADEMGLYPDPLARLGMLTYDSLRSCRLVVDTGLHAKGWTRQQAIDYMSAHVPISLAEIEVEVDRYIAMPGQAVAYKIGQNEILRYRAHTAERLGDRFDIKTFHDRVLSAGSVSLPVLKELAASV